MSGVCSIRETRLRARAGALVVAGLIASATLAAAPREADAQERGATRASLRVRVQNRLRALRRPAAKYIPERRWNQHPAVRRAIGTFRAEAGREMRDADFDVHAVFAGGVPAGYTIHTASRAYDGSTAESVLQVDLEGRITRKTKAKGSEIPLEVKTATWGAGRGRAASRMRMRRGRQVLETVPGSGLVTRWWSARTARRAGLIEAFAAEQAVASQLADQAADPHVADVTRYSFHDDSWVFAVSDLHSGIGGTDPNEDFRAGGPAMAKWLGTLNDGGRRRATLVCGGDCFEFMENAPINASDDELKAIATRFIEGHAETYRALAAAVVPKIAGQPDRGLRFILTRGNHDIQMVKKDLRDHIVNEMARVGGLAGEDVGVFKQRVAYAGDMAVLGRRGEMVMIHGDIADPTNSWRENANPFRYQITRGGPWAVLKSLVKTGRLPPLRVSRRLENNMGYTIVQHFYKFIEQRAPEADNSQKATAHFIGKGLLTRPGNFLRLGRVLWTLLGKQKVHEQASLAATRRDDHATALAWAERTQAHLQWGLASPAEVVARLDRIRAQMPDPVHEQMSSPLRVVNLVRMLLGARRVARERDHAESQLAGLLTSELPNVVDVIAGHTHDQSRLEGTTPDRGRVVFRNTGTWTMRRGDDVFTVAVSKADGGGLVEQGLFRFDDAAGQLVLQRDAPAPTWSGPAAWGPPTAAAPAAITTAAAAAF